MNATYNATQLNIHKSSGRLPEQWQISGECGNSVLLRSMILLPLLICCLLA